MEFFGQLTKITFVGILAFQNIYEGWCKYLFIFFLLDIFLSLFCGSPVDQNI